MIGKSLQLDPRSFLQGKRASGGLRSNELASESAV